MLDTRLARLAGRQDDVCAVWQLMAWGWSERAVKHRTAGLRRLHDGVFVLGQAPPTQRQRWRAATLTTPRSVLSHASAAASYGVRPNPGSFETITRPGKGGPVRIGDLLVLRSSTLGPVAGSTSASRDIAHDRGLPRTTIERTLVDLAPTLPARQLRKLFREALRLRRTTAPKVSATLARHPGRRGSAELRELADRYVRLPIDRCRSDGEAMALELLDRHHRPIPLVNTLVAGSEADQYFPDHRLVVEIDGPGFHVLRDDDARKTAVWRAAGLTVRRVSSDDVFDHPER
jgi:hypothetical protein